MNTLVGIIPDGLYIFLVNVGSKKRVFKISQCCNNIDTNKEKEKIDRNAQKGRGEDINYLFFV
jgi:hypothetical protein